jgi:hypothetical protein
MITTIDNTSRIFVIIRQGFFSRSYVCNLETIPGILQNELEINDDFIILEMFNYKLKKCSKKQLNSMFEAHKINFKIQ